MPTKSFRHGALKLFDLLADVDLALRNRAVDQPAGEVLIDIDRVRVEEPEERERHITDVVGDGLTQLIGLLQKAGDRPVFHDRILDHGDHAIVLHGMMPEELVEPLRSNEPQLLGDEVQVALGGCLGDRLVGDVALPVEYALLQCLQFHHISCRIVRWGRNV
jgi:hypothetical protein